MYGVPTQKHTEIECGICDLQDYFMAFTFVKEQIIGPFDIFFDRVEEMCQMTDYIPKDK